MFSNLSSAEQTMHWFAQIGGDNDSLALSGMRVDQRVLITFSVSVVWNSLPFFLPILRRQKSGRDCTPIRCITHSCAETLLIFQKLMKWKMIYCDSSFQLLKWSVWFIWLYLYIINKRLMPAPKIAIWN